MKHSGPKNSWWGRRRKGAKVALVLAGVIVLAALAGGVTPVVVKALQPSDAELVQTLATTADAGERHDAAVDLGARHSAQATRDLIAAAATGASAQEGLAALRDEYVAVLTAAPSADYSDEKDRGALTETVDCLAVIGDQTSIEAMGDLVRAPQSSSDILGVKTHSLEALGSLKDDIAISQLIAVISASSGLPSGSQLRSTASSALKARPEAVDLLIQARLKSSTDSSFCSTVDSTLVGIGQPAAAALVALKGKEEWRDEVLLRIGVGTAPSLVEELGSQDPTRRDWALGVLLDLYRQDAGGMTRYLAVSELGPLLVQARSKAAYADERDTAIEAVLAKIGVPAVAALVAVPPEEDWSGEVLCEIGVGAVPAVVQELNNEDPLARYRALGVLVLLYQQDPKAVSAQVAVPGLVPLLMEARAQAHYADERDAATEAVLAAIGEPAVKPLVTLLGGSDWAGAALVKMGVVVIPAVSGELDSKKAAVRYGALGVLLRLYAADNGALASTLVRADLVSLLIEARNKAGYGGDRDAAIAAVLTKIGEPAAKSLVALLPGSTWAGDVLAGMGKTAVPALLSALKSKSSDTRFAAADVLVQMQRSDPAIVLPLMSALENDNLKYLATNYAFYIRLGQSGTEEILARALQKYGNKQMALDYLNCGNDQLDAAARQWAANHGYRVYTKEGTYGGPRWGEG